MRSGAGLGWLAAVALTAIGLILLPAGASADTPANPWLERSFINIAHQGGEDEFPSNTTYAFRRAIHAGADMLELDVSRTKDDVLVVMHDTTVDRTTNGTGSLAALTLAEVRGLDAAHWFVPGRNTPHGLPAEDYPLRGVRTGDQPPPRGFSPEDFRVQTLEEVLRAFPGTPINIEIKGDGDPADYARNADLLAALLERVPRRDVIVVSFDQAAIDRFHAALPDVPVAPGIVGVAGFILGGIPPTPGTVALQIPITFQLGPTLFEVTTPASVLAAHRAGLAVHTWLSGNGEEDAATWNLLLDTCVDGIMTARPAELERLLRERDVARPGGGRGVDPCGVDVGRPAIVSGRTLRLSLARRGLGPQAVAGEIVVRAGRGRRLGRRIARGPLSLSEGAVGGDVALRLSRRGRRIVRRGLRRATAIVAVEGGRGRPARFPVVVR